MPVRQHYNVTLAILTMAGTAFALQQTLVVPALPALQRELDTTTTWVTWVLTVFLLSASVLTPLLGKLGDQYGKERLLVISLATFLVGCIGSALAPNIAVLIAFRALAGAGAAVFPLSFAIIKDEFPSEKIGMAIAVVSSIFAVAGGVGLAVSGVIVDELSWRFLFAVGAIPVAIATLLVHKLVPESPIKTRGRLDLRGALLLAGALTALLLALTEGADWGWTSPPILALAAAACALLVAWTIVEHHVPNPMVDLKMLAGRTVLLANVVTLVGAAAVHGAWVLIPNFVSASSAVGGYGFDAPAESAFTAAFWASAAMALLAAGVAVLVTARPARALGARPTLAEAVE